MKTTQQFIKECKQIHGDKYDYSKVNYHRALEKVCIICPKHGEFWQTPNSHLSGRSCPKCSKEKVSKKMKEKWKITKKKYVTNLKKDVKQFIKECKQIHDDKYDYSKVEYKGNKIKVCIICPEHGEFWQTPTNHLNKQQCPICAKFQRIKNNSRTQEEFIELSKLKHCNFYTYENVKYIKSRSKVIITCPIHGDFEQSPDNHLKGCGCPKCQNSQLENNVRKFLLQNNIIFIEYYRPYWLKCEDGIHSQSLDFYLPEYNVAIECQGRQHFKTNNDNFGSKHKTCDEIYDEIYKRDIRKNNLCKENNIKILYFSEKNDHTYDFPLITNLNDLLHEIIS